MPASPTGINRAVRTYAPAETSDRQDTSNYIAGPARAACHTGEQNVRPVFEVCSPVFHFCCAQPPSSSLRAFAAGNPARGYLRPKGSTHRSNRSLSGITAGRIEPARNIRHHGTRAPTAIPETSRSDSTASSRRRVAAFYCVKGAGDLCAAGTLASRAPCVAERSNVGAAETRGDKHSRSVFEESCAGSRISSRQVQRRSSSGMTSIERVTASAARLPGGLRGK